MMLTTLSFNSLSTMVVGFAIIIMVALGPLEVTCDGTSVTLYSGTYYTRDEREIYLEQGQCFPLFGLWRTNIASIKFDQYTCFQIFYSDDCSGNSKVFDGQYVRDRDESVNLAISGFLFKVHSLKLC